MIYFIQAGVDGPVKIGFSKSSAGVYMRRRTMQTGHYERLRLLSLVEGDRDDERALHEFFASDRLEGEWFRPSDAVMELALDPRWAAQLLGQLSNQRRWRDAGFVDVDGRVTSLGCWYFEGLERFAAERGCDLDAWPEQAGVAS